MDPPFRRARLPRAAKDKVNPERSNPHAQSENASSNMLPKPFGPEGSEQDGHRAQTAHRIQEMNLSNPPQIGQDDGMKTSLLVWANLLIPRQRRADGNTDMTDIFQI